jgi:alkanesulfonate monooxygenase SsuD/methylene tetrahydromethanopterin reductase-like flavin-dependent oxidoreductase (luciferase family)
MDNPMKSQSIHYGIEVVPFGPYSDPRLVVELAQAAEAAGWEAITLWDHVLFPYGAGDPWITLAAVATATRTLKLCTDVSPLPRYSPHVLARTLIALDILSQGRVILGAGAGVDFDFTPVDPTTSLKRRAEILDESLAILAHLLAGEPVTFHGAHFTFDNVQLAPGPVQRPRIPVWIGGDSQPAYRRAAKWDGWVIGTIDEQQNITLTPAQVAERVAAIRSHRTDDAPFAVAVSGATAPGNAALPQAYAAVGATWWFETIFASRGSHAEMLARIEAGPPR